MQDAITILRVQRSRMLKCLILMTLIPTGALAHAGAVSPEPNPAPSPGPQSIDTLAVRYIPPPLPDSWTLTHGYLFVEDRYIPLGSEINILTGKVTLPSRSSESSAVYAEMTLAGDTDERPSKVVNLPNYSDVAQQIYDTLRFDGVVVCRKTCEARTWPLADGGTAILACILNPTNAEGHVAESLPDAFQKDAWQQWLTTTSYSSDFAERAESEVTRWVQTIAANETQSVARQRLASLNYPLTLIGMVLVVVSFGQLLWFRPGVTQLAAEGHTPITPETATARCVALFVLMATLDLALTILAHQAHAMLEINPIGNKVLSSIPMLITFKVSLTAFAAAVLLYARRQKIAQFTAWWGCLIMCLLTARWVVFNQLGG